MTKLLLAEHDSDSRQSTADWLMREKYVLEVVFSSDRLYLALRENHYDLIVLDLAMPGLNPVESCREYRFNGGMAPILLLCDSNTSEERIAGLDAGADDYLLKPFQLRELAATIRCLLRRPAVVVEDVLRVGDIVMDVRARSVNRQGKVIELYPLEFNLLEFLLRHPNQVYSAEALGARIWKSNSSSLLVDTVRTHIKTLRRKLDIDGGVSLISTVHGRGYKIEIL